MKKTCRLSMITIMLIALVYLIGNAQPYPPPDPEGESVPVEGMISLLLPAIIYFVARLYRKTKK